LHQPVKLGAVAVGQPSAIAIGQFEYDRWSRSKLARLGQRQHLHAGREGAGRCASASNTRGGGRSAHLLFTLNSWRVARPGCRGQCLEHSGAKPLERLLYGTSFTKVVGQQRNVFTPL
jgi:hypothetical protein